MLAVVEVVGVNGRAIEEIGRGGAGWDELAGFPLFPHLKPNLLPVALRVAGVRGERTWRISSWLAAARRGGTLCVQWRPHHASSLHTARHTDITRHLMFVLLSFCSPSKSPFFTLCVCLPVSLSPLPFPFVSFVLSFACCACIETYMWTLQPYRSIQSYRSIHVKATALQKHTILQKHTCESYSLTEAYNPTEAYMWKLQPYRSIQSYRSIHVKTTALHKHTTL